MAFGIFSPKEEYKLVVLVRTDLDMGKGKIAAQVGHASVECALRAEKKDRKAFDSWMDCGQRKVVLKVSGKDEMIRYMNEARSARRIRDQRGRCPCHVQGAEGASAPSSRRRDPRIRDRRGHRRIDQSGPITAS